MLLDYVKTVGPMLMEDQKPRARWRQLQSQVALGTELHLQKAQKTCDLLTMVVMEEGISRRVSDGLRAGQEHHAGAQ